MSYGTDVLKIERMCIEIAKNSIQGDGSLNLSEAQKIARVKAGQKISTTCGPLAGVAMSMLAEIGFSSRVVQSLTLDAWNSYNNGHTMFEVWDGRRWTLYDLTNKVRPLYRGASCRITDFTQSMLENVMNLKTLSRSPIFDPKWSYAKYPEFKYFNLIAWYKRVLQVPMVFDGAHYRFENRSDLETARVESYSSAYKRMPRGPFRELLNGAP